MTESELRQVVQIHCPRTAETIEPSSQNPNTTIVTVLSVAHGLEDIAAAARHLASRAIDRACAEQTSAQSSAVLQPKLEGALMTSRLAS